MNNQFLALMFLLPGKIMMIFHKSCGLQPGGSNNCLVNGLIASRRKISGHAHRQPTFLARLIVETELNIDESSPGRARLGSDYQARVKLGDVDILGLDLQKEQLQIRRAIGVVFQAPSLDKKLTVLENIRYQAALYGVTGAELRIRAPS